MAKKNNSTKPKKAQKKTQPGFTGNKRVRAKKQKKYELALAAKKGITEKDLRKGNVSRETFNEIVTQEKAKEQAKAAKAAKQKAAKKARASKYEEKRRYAAKKAIPEKYLGGVYNVKEKDLDKWVAKVKRQIYQEEKEDILRAKGVHPDWWPKLTRENGKEKLQQLTPELWPQYFKPKERNKFNPDKYYTFQEWFYCGLADRTEFSNLAHRARFYQTLTPEEAGANISDTMNSRTGTGRGSAGQAGVLRLVVSDSEERVFDEVERWENLEGDKAYQTIFCTNKWSLNKALQNTAFVMASCTEEYQQIFYDKMCRYLADNNPRMYEEFIKNI